MRLRQISLRAFDADDLMVDADLVDGREMESVIERLFADPHVAYIAGSLREARLLCRTH